MTISVLLFCLRTEIAAMYTDDFEVKQMVCSVLRLVAPLYLIDGMKGYMVGPIRSLGI